MKPPGMTAVGESKPGAHHFGSSERILVLPASAAGPEAFDAILKGRGMEVEECADLEKLCRAIDTGAGTALIGTEFLDRQGLDQLRESLSRQPDWSDFPLIILVEAGAVETGWRVLREFESAGNVVLLERTAMAPVVTGAVQAALRSRRRQYAVRDRVNEQERREQALKETGEHSREMLESAKDYAIFSLDPQGRVTSWNAGAEKVFGYARQEMMGRDGAILFTPEDRAEGVPQQEMSNAAQAGAAEDRRWHLRKDGSRFFAGGMMRPIWDEAGNLRGFTKVARDVTRFKQAQDELARVHALAERRVAELNAVIESMPDAVYIGNAEGITKCNTNALKVLGASSVEDFNARIAELGEKFAIRWPDGRRLCTEELQFVRALKGETAIEEVIARRADTGEDVYFRAASAPIYEEGRIVGAVSVNSDITREKQAEQAVRESEERYRAFVQNSSEAIWRFELDKPVPVTLPEDEQVEWLYRHGYMAECNQVMARMFGYSSPEEMRGVRLENILPHIDKNIDFLRAFVRSGYRLVEAESVDVDKHGNVKHALNNIVGVVKDGFGMHAWGTNRDITHRKKAELAQANLAAIVASSEDVIISKDLDGRITSWNEAASRVFGYTAAEAMGQSIMMLIPPERHAEEDEILTRLNRGERLGHYETMRRAKDGRRIDVSLSVSPIKDASGKVIGAAKILRDITERKRVEESLQQARNELSRHAVELEKRVVERTATLQASLQSLEGVLYHVAHDLRAPLRAMQGFTTILLGEYGLKLDAAGQDYARRISHAASRMDKLIHDLLGYGRLAHVPVSQEELELEHELAVMLNSLSAEIQNRNAKVEVERPLPAVRGDSAMLQLVLRNLAWNALTFVAPGVPPLVKIGAEQKGPDVVRIWMADNGIGIEPEHQERVFRVFERLRGNDVYTGTGIGLAMVRKGVERMGGRAGVTSKPGEGSCFWLEMPAASKSHER